MHSKCYTNLHKAGIIDYHDSPKTHNNTGEEVFDEAEMTRLPTHYYLEHSNYLLFVDEVGSNLHCDTDKNISQEKYLRSETSKYANIHSNNNECRFSILGFTVATGNAVIAVCIIKAEKLSYK